MLKLLPNFLTLFRIFMIPALVIVYLIPGPLGHWLAVLIFYLAAITDYLDGVHRVPHRDSEGGEPSHGAYSGPCDPHGHTGPAGFHHRRGVPWWSRLLEDPGGERPQDSGEAGAVDPGQLVRRDCRLPDGRGARPLVRHLPQGLISTSGGSNPRVARAA